MLYGKQAVKDYPLISIKIIDRSPYSLSFPRVWGWTSVSQNSFLHLMEHQEQDFTLPETIFKKLNGYLGDNPLSKNYTSSISALTALSESSLNFFREENGMKTLENIIYPQDL